MGAKAVSAVSSKVMSILTGGDMGGDVTDSALYLATMTQPGVIGSITAIKAPGAGEKEELSAGAGVLRVVLGASVGLPPSQIKPAGGDKGWSDSVREGLEGLVTCRKDAQD